MGHEVVRVFFYHEGVYHAFRYAAPPDDEIQSAARWSRLANKFNIDLVVCISAAQRRGLLEATEASRLGKKAYSFPVYRTGNNNSHLVLIPSDIQKFLSEFFR